MSGRDSFETWAATAVEVRELAALTDDGTPVLVDPSRPDVPACRARSVLDLHGGHIGQQVVVMFEAADPGRPIVMGLLRGNVEERPEHMAVESDGRRMIVSAREQLVLRCGAASITLTREGKVLVEGTYLLSKSKGVNRIKGGSVQLN
jgi:hypothetical protein